MLKHHSYSAITSVSRSIIAKFGLTALAAAWLLFTPFTVLAEDPINTNVLVETAVNHIYQKRYKQAYEILRQAYENSPRHPGVHFNLGRLFELTGNFSEALKEYQLAAVLDPSMIAARRGIGRCSVEIKREKSEEQGNITAQVMAQAASERQTRRPEPDQGPANRPQNFRNNQPPAKLRAPVVVQTAAIERQPIQMLPAMSRSTELPAVEDLRVPPLPPQVTQRVRQQSKSNAESRIESELENGNLSQALSVLPQMVEADPDNPRLHYLLGKAFSMKGDLFGAIKHLEETIKVDEHFHAAYYLLAQNYAKVNLLDDAIKNYNAYFAVKPQAGVAVEIARVYERMGRSDLAREFYNKANAMNPGNAAIQTRVVAIEGEQANDLYLRANHAFTLNDFSGALSMYQQALSLSGLDDTYKRDALRKVEMAKLRAAEVDRQEAPARQGFDATRRIYGNVNLAYPDLANISFKTSFTGPVTVEWRGYIARIFQRYGRDFLLMIKELDQSELDRMKRDRNEYRLNPNFNNQPLFLVSISKGNLPPFAKEGTMITFTGSTDWNFYDVINDLGQTVKLPSFDLLSATP
ncbi:MAG: tetratricopeptide repeat protein [Candidatus Riflebacteria bacterium]|nr:tetratricopeptide repeat protein [Candidatus Riflebacteria bacterium]